MDCYAYKLVGLKSCECGRVGSNISKQKRAQHTNDAELFKSGRQDSNLRPPAPKAGALTGLRYAPNIFDGGERGIRTPGTVSRTPV